MIDELIAAAIVLFSIYIFLKTYDNISWKIYNYKSRKIKCQTLFHSEEYRKIIHSLNDLDEIEDRKKELEDAPKKLCNQSCTAKQKYLKSLYERGLEIYGKVQTILLLDIKKSMDNFEKKYQKRFDKIKKKYNLSPKKKTWNFELKHYE